MNRFTIRLYDGMSHYDFPCYMANSEVYHSILGSYPIKAVHTEGSGCDILRGFSEKKMTGYVLEKMSWSEEWRMQFYYHMSGDETVLCCTGGRMRMFDQSDSIRSLTVGDEIEIGLNFDDLSFRNVNNASHTKYEKDSRISNLYSEESELLIVDLEERKRIQPDGNTD